MHHGLTLSSIYISCTETRNYHGEKPKLPDLRHDVYNPKKNPMQRPLPTPFWPELLSLGHAPILSSRSGVSSNSKPVDVEKKVENASHSQRRRGHRQRPLIYSSLSGTIFENRMPRTCFIKANGALCIVLLQNLLHYFVLTTMLGAATPHGVGSHHFKAGAFNVARTSVLAAPIISVSDAFNLVCPHPQICPVALVNSFANTVSSSQASYSRR